MILKRILLFIFLLSGLFSHSIAQSQKEINSENQSQLELSKQKMDSVFTAILEKYEDSPEFIASLKKAQEAWINFRDVHLESVYPGKDKRAKYGTVYSSCAASLLVKLNNQRTEQLRMWLEGTEEGDVCAGSVKLSSQLE
ncbi:DUF1311 domain-containing protein [Aliifodinibius sp. S!AR15-10]|uniref:lysozyme inhibitor LprI family protein n=1 Tax=Aliifodinibius sp. S!AR15-10 TaxID=2950437 RepID=UPI002862882F|nr:lysozyme inhibitor LprI family protein [Aliifodinibius sp. S!AR15-10]MDR8394292.1 DUF1311 domain-containing protein [Aliifodinibius sp. S!AR15-10]